MDADKIVTAARLEERVINNSDFHSEDDKYTEVDEFSPRFYRGIGIITLTAAGMAALMAYNFISRY